MKNDVKLTPIQILVHGIDINMKSLESQNDALGLWAKQLRDFGVEFEICSSLTDEVSYYLDFNGEQLSLIDLKKSSKLTLDWAKELKSHLKKRYAVTKEPLFRALKLKGDDLAHNQIIDATMGTGKDACLLLSFKCNLICFERNPYVFALGLWAYLQACASDDEMIAQAFKNQMRLEYGQAYSSEIPAGYDRCFYDPMYESGKSKTKSALSRKEMETFKELVGSDQDQATILSELCKKFKLVCFKRPLKAPNLELPDDSRCQKVVYTGKSTRYERYFIP
ncbi:hypothetical protein DAY19_12100 [Halobacteriovorax vibrionivorans]|uniref:SAM-dependent methyltransferase n=1 Tax=Halobacteriovorax vibrionivorans TaxID=2152716 RepID=A0ABY0ICQ0_9BACT|nr:MULTISPECIES: class I SAM-dependent methyltransferase [Halobacteriovorax]RZF20721.1 hypothetical protein DAY19_12100 [Halobacteriovorax vibrionivorans]TGD48870.1 hypothetical protein EP118_01630 [Halobacteriovorax sp. Y22]